MFLTKLAIARPVFILMLMLAAILMGIIAFQSMRVEENPDVDFGVITVQTVYPGAGPEEVNTLVSRRIEDSISGVAGLQQITASSLEGFSIVVAQFEIGTDMNEALNDVRSRIDEALARLPREAEKPTISKFDFATMPVMTLALRSDTLDSRQLYDLADDQLKDRFARIRGVGAVNVSGGDVREIQVQVRRDRLVAFGLGILDVQRAVQAATLNVPSGRVVTGDREFAVRVLGEFRSVQEIRDMRLSVQNPHDPMAPPAVVRLGDVADVKDGVAERRQFSRLDGSDTVILNIQKTKEGNAVEISAAAHRLIPQLERQFGLHFVTAFDQSVSIRESLFDLTFALLFGIFLVTVIVYMFLHNLRGTVIVGLAIPICLLSTFVVLWALGFTINTMSMLALALAVGVLVDDCIVVIENIYRHLRMGEDPVDAAINGRGEIGLAAIAITLADVVVFIPIAFMGGMVGQFFKPLGIGFAVAVLASLFVSFTVTPMLASRWYRKGEDLEHPTGRFARSFERLFQWVVRAYKRQLAWALRHRWFVFISGFVALIAVVMGIAGSFAPSLAGAFSMGVPLAFVAIAIGGLVFVGNALRRIVKPKFLVYGAAYGLVFPLACAAGYGYGVWKGDAVFKFQFFPASDQGRVSARIALPPGSSLAATQEVVERIERIVAAHPDTKYVVSNLGTRGGGWGGPPDTGSNYAEVNVTLHYRIALLDRIMFWRAPGEQLRTRSDTAVAADMLEAIGRIPGATVTVAATAAEGFGAPIQMAFKGDDRELLQRVALRVRDGLAAGAVEGVINPEVSAKPGKPELRAVPDRLRLADAGLTTAAVAHAMRILYEGDDSAKFRVRGREFDIRVMMSLEDRNNPEIISQLPVTFQQGRPIYLSQVAALAPGTGVDKIERRDRTEEVRVQADLVPGLAAGNVQAKINAWIEREGLIPEGVTRKELGQAEMQAREGVYLVTALLLGLILVYMVLASLYDNLLYPFIIQLAQPQAMVGALLALVLTDKVFSIVAFLGIIALTGLVGKNAILLVDYTNTLRKRGMARHEAIMLACPTRLRPIAMTTLAVILGMLPVALAIGRGSEFRETLGITIIGGMALSTALTLLVIPCSYTIFDDISERLGRMFHGDRAARRWVDSPGEGPGPSRDGELEAEPAAVPEAPRGLG
jgi:HAE1 family hydrophobic/amphiphilic exporter-1